MLACTACFPVATGTTLSFDRGKASEEAFFKARNVCRYEVRRVSLRARRADRDHGLFIACMESKGFAFKAYKATFSDYACAEGTPGRNAYGHCRISRPWPAP